MTIDELEIDEEALRETFCAEAVDSLASIEESVLSLETFGVRPRVIAQLLREAHTLKGSAACAGLNAFAEQAHLLEQIVEDVRDGRLVVSRNSTSLLLSSVDTMRRMLASPDQRRSLLVDIAKLDRLLDLTSEMAIARGRLKQTLARADATREELLSCDLESDRLYGELQELAMSVRTIPVATLFQQSLRVVRDLSASLRKEVRLEIAASDVELDTSLVDELRAALLHLVRNAIDHGIEASGTIRLDARQQGGLMILDVSDDGRGLDLDAIRRTAIARGLVGADEPLTPEQTRDLIFRSGFSTAETVSDISGRGVGLDVVRQRIGALRGTIRVADANPGTRFTIVLPLTVSILDGFHVVSGEETFVIPLDNVVECLAAPPQARGSFTMQVRGEALGCVELAQLHGVRSNARTSVVVVSDGERRAGLLVDALLGASEVVVKPLPAAVPRSRSVASSTILPDGRVALLLDVASILRPA
ncbi:MAG TPA: chemotaxis protein CheW [Thermoanaerobaculia bacterium]|jgi:two-component system chemotaxis sensor kinase CheA